MRRVIIESPYAGKVRFNEEYARRCVYDSIMQGEVPFASHLFYTQVLDDLDPAQRSTGIFLGSQWIASCDFVAVYRDLDISAGMQEAIDYAERIGKPIVERWLGVINTGDLREPSWWRKLLSRPKRRLADLKLAHRREVWKSMPQNLEAREPTLSEEINAILARDAPSPVPWGEQAQNETYFDGINLRDRRTHQIVSVRPTVK